jgi:hypothetical protein
VANNLIQIRRSLNTANATSLANGELAFTSNGDVLWIGANGATIPIAGKRFPGTLTANQALVANASSGIDKIIVANLVPQFISANGSLGTAGHVLKSAGSSANVYWEAVTVAAGVAGSDTQIQYNDGGSTLAGATGFTYSKTTNNVAIANTLHIPANNAFGNATTGGTLANSTTFASGNSTVYAIHTSAGIQAYTNSTVNSTMTAALVQVSNSSATANLTAIALTVGTSVVNTTVLAAGANVIANTTALFVGNSTVNAIHTATLLQVSNSTATANLSSIDLRLGGYGGATVGTVTNNTIFAVGNNSVNTQVKATGVDVGANVSINTTAFDVGVTVISSTNAAFGGSIAVNNSIGTAGYVLVSGGATNAYWSNSLPGTYNFTDLQVSGNLTVLGDLVSLNVATLAIEDSVIALAKDQSSTGTFTDVVDIGFFGTYGNTANAFVSGFFRDQSDSGIWKVFTSNGTYTNAIIDTSNTAAFAFATLQTQLRTGGVGAGAFISNTTVVNITANAIVSVAIAANTLTLTTPLAGTSGGTGKSTMTSQAILVGNTTNGYNELALGADGRVLQSNGTALVYDVLDGGTF